jgi:hypothetical protein
MNKNNRNILGGTLTTYTDGDWVWNSHHIQLQPGRHLLKFGRNGDVLMINILKLYIGVK